jgi:hypothetical protein
MAIACLGVCNTSGYGGNMYKGAMAVTLNMIHQFCYKLLTIANLQAMEFFELQAMESQCTDRELWTMFYRFVAALRYGVVCSSNWKV